MNSMMDQRVIRPKLGLLKLAEQLDSISKSLQGYGLLITT